MLNWLFANTHFMDSASHYRGSLGKLTMQAAKGAPTNGDVMFIPEPERRASYFALLIKLSTFSHRFPVIP